MKTQQQHVVVKIYRSDSHYQRDAQRMGAAGYTVQSTDHRRGDIALARNTLTTMVTLGFSQKFGGNAHKKQKITVTYTLVQQSQPMQQMVYAPQVQAPWSPADRTWTDQPMPVATMAGAPVRPYRRPRFTKARMMAFMTFIAILVIVIASVH